MGLKRPRLEHFEKVQFLEQLSAMLQAGLGLTSALDALAHSVSLDQGELARGLLKELHKGKRLSAGFAEFEESFDAVFVSAVYSAEESGTLVATLKKLSEQLARAEKSRRALWASLSYPLIQLVVTFMMLGFLLYYMLPRFLPFFAVTGQELPTLTRWVWSLSHLWVVKGLPIAFLVAAVAFYRAWRMPRSREKILVVAYHVPGLGRMLLHQSLADACAQLALQLDSGLLLDRSLHSVAKCSPYPPISAMFDRIRRGVREGEGIQELAESEPLLPPIVAICLAVGDEIGRMPAMLKLAGEILLDEVEVKRDAFFQLVEPLLLMFMGISVGFVVLACFLPVYHLAMANF